MPIKVLSTDEMAFIKNLPNKELEDKIILIVLKKNTITKEKTK